MTKEFRGVDRRKGGVLVLTKKNIVVVDTTVQMSCQVTQVDGFDVEVASPVHEKRCCR